jgi:hypothetical protein
MAADVTAEITEGDGENEDSDRGELSHVSTCTIITNTTAASTTASSSGTGSDLNIRLMHKARDIRTLRGKLDKSDGENRNLKVQLQMCQETQRDLKGTKGELLDMKTKLRAVKGELADVKQAHASAIREVSELKSKASYKTLLEREKKLKVKESVLAQHEDRGCDEKISNLKHDKKCLQTLVSKYQISEKNLKEDISLLRQECQKLAVEIEDQGSGGIVVPKLKEGNKYTHALVKCIIQLIGEIGIASRKSGPVILCVAKCSH